MRIRIRQNDADSTGSGSTTLFLVFFCGTLSGFAFKNAPVMGAYQTQDVPVTIRWLQKESLGAGLRIRVSQKTQHFGCASFSHSLMSLESQYDNKKFFFHH
jgi:hypothetical protein